MKTLSDEKALERVGACSVAAILAQATNCTLLIDFLGASTIYCDDRRFWFLVVPLDLLRLRLTQLWLIITVTSVGVITI